MRDFKVSTILLSLVTVILSGTIFFHFVEGWSLLDSYFFTVITISTVGYGKLVPVTALGKIGTTFLIFGGLGVFAVAIHKFANFHMQKREEHTEWLVGHLGNRKTEQEPPAANEDERPNPTHSEHP